MCCYMKNNFRQVPNIDGLECTKEGIFRYNGKPKKVIYCHTVTGRKATARVMIMINGKSRYWQAAKLVASTWKRGYEDGDYITYKDGNCHNIQSDNLRLDGKKGYYDYMLRNSVNKADTIDERKRKLQLVADEALMTKHYFETLKMDEINKHVTDYLYPTLMKYALNTLYMGEIVALELVPEALARMYECIMNGMCLYNYERYCKKLLHNYKTKGTFGMTGNIPKPIHIQVEQLNLDRLWERYKVTKLK